MAIQIGLLIVTPGKLPPSVHAYASVSQSREALRQLLESFTAKSQIKEYAFYRLFSSEDHERYQYDRTFIDWYRVPLRVDSTGTTVLHESSQEYPKAVPETTSAGQCGVKSAFTPVPTAAPVAPITTPVVPITTPVVPITTPVVPITTPVVPITTPVAGSSERTDIESAHRAIWREPDAAWLCCFR
jgi:hypothetical protein